MNVPWLLLLAMLPSLSAINLRSSGEVRASAQQGGDPSPTAMHNLQAGQQKFVCRRAGQCLAYSPVSRPLLVWNRSGSEGMTQIHIEENYTGPVSFHGAEDSKQEKLCINGRIAPSLFVLGAQKCATTNFFHRLVDVALNVVPPVAKPSDPFYFYKELHVFDHPSRFDEIGRDGWLSYYPECAASAYAVGVDATPSYVSNPMAPSRMAQFYGGEHTSRLTFLVLLRNPMKRMHSSFYHAKRNSGCKENPVYCGTFQEYITRALFNCQLGCFTGKDYTAGNKWTNATLVTQTCLDPDDLPYGDPLYLSLYEPQLLNWFKVFAPSQFVIAPFLTYVAPKAGVPSLVQLIAGRISSTVKSNAELGAFPKSTQAAGNNGLTNPALETDLQNLGAEKAQHLNRIVEAKTGPAVLAKLLGPAMKQGLTLFGYTGNPDDYAAVANWISTNW